MRSYVTSTYWKNSASLENILSRSHFFLFTGALFLTLFQKSFSWIGYAGWAVLFVFFLKRTDFVVYSLFFFSSFFHSSGLFPNPLFSVKHLHAACLLSVLAGWRRDPPFKVLADGARRNRGLWLIYGVWVLAALAGLFPPSIKALKISLNWMFVLGFTIYLLGFLKERPELLKKSLFFFLCGIVVQCLIGYFNLATGRNWLEMSIIHNNHLSLLLCFGLFYSLWLFLEEDRKIRGSVFLAAISLMFVTLGLSLSRTGWLSFLLNFILFAGFIASNGDVPGKVKRRLAVVVGLFVLATACCVIRHDFCERFFSVGCFLTGKDVYKHGGFFSRFRPELMERVLSVPIPRLVFGSGFLHWITDIHSLYLVFFAASGAIGLVLFVAFVSNLFIRSFFLVDQSLNWRSRIFRLSVFCTVSSWVLTSVMTTLFLQFYIWLSLAVAIFTLSEWKKQLPPVDRPLFASRLQEVQNLCPHE